MLGMYKVAPAGVDVTITVTEARERSDMPGPKGPGLQTPAVGRVLSDPPKKKGVAPPQQPHSAKVAPKQDHDEKKRIDAEVRKKQKAAGARQARIATLEARIADTEAAIREVEQQMSAPGFYEDRTGAQPVIDRHQTLMWQVGDLMNQWEELHTLTDLPGKTKS
jgi:hypothetical protein